MKSHFYYIAALLLVVAAACKKELEQVPYKLTTNELTIQLDSNNFSVITLDTLKIRATISESKPEGHTFTYSWQVWPNLNEGDLQEISREKDLNVKILLAPNDYRYRLVITDQVTGIAYIKHGYLSVESPFSEGWVVTHNSNGKGHVGFIRTIDDKVFLSPIEEVNNKTYSEGIAAYTAGFTFNPSYLQLIFLTKTGAYRFDSQSFVQVTDNQHLFFDGAAINFGATGAYGYDGRGARQLIFNDGNVYAANALDVFNGFSFSEKFSSRLPGDYKAFPFLFKLGTIGTTTAFFDNKSKSIKVVDATLAVTDLAATTGLTNLGRTMIAADMGPAQEYFCVLRDEGTSKHYLFSFAGTTGTYTSGTHKNQEILNAPDIAAATCFTTSRTTKVLYYSVGNKVYLYDANANSAKLIYTFPAGYVIKDLQMLKETYKQIEYSSALHNKRLAVAVDNGTSGEVYFLDLNSVGEVLNNTYSKKFTGFGNIAHLNVKSPY